VRSNEVLDALTAKTNGLPRGSGDHPASSADCAMPMICFDETFGRARSGLMRWAVMLPPGNSIMRRCLGGPTGTTSTDIPMKPDAAVQRGQWRTDQTSLCPATVIGLDSCEDIA